MRIEELISSEQMLVMHCADIKSQLTLLLDAKGMSALEGRVVKQLAFQTSVVCAVQVRPCDCPAVARDLGLTLSAVRRAC